MSKSKYFLIVFIVLIFFVISLYVFNFYYLLSYKISSDTSDWSNFGGYFGGILGPVLSFASIVLLLESLKLQMQTNSELKEEVIQNRKVERLRSYESTFFNMISCQKSLFDSFKVTIDSEVFFGIDAVQRIEDRIESFRADYPDDDSLIVSFLYDLGESESIYNSLRSFYILVKLTTDKLSDVEGFEHKDRIQHLTTLVNFTDFALLRLVLICMQFYSIPPVEYLKSSREFNAVLYDVGLTGVSY